MVLPSRLDDINELAKSEKMGATGKPTGFSSWFLLCIFQLRTNKVVLLDL